MDELPISPPATATDRKSVTRGMSLHIGLNAVDPEHYRGWDGALYGCEFDAHDMEQLAESREFETRKLLTNEATADNIITAIDDAARELRRGDIFFLSFAGHGGQVPDSNDEESDGSDETWLAYDREIVDDELYVQWRRFRPGVRVVVVSDSCHGGAVTSGRDFLGTTFTEPFASESAVAAHSPLYRGMPRDVMISTYQSNRDLYEGIQETVPSVDASKIRATVLALLACQDHQLARDGPSNGLFTEHLLAVWDGGAWKGDHAAFNHAIRARMPDGQQPNYRPIRATSGDFERQVPFTIA